MRIKAVRAEPSLVIRDDVPVAVEVDVALSVPGDLGCYVLIRIWRVGQIDTVSPTLRQAAPGLHTLRMVLPASLLGTGLHAVDVEVWVEGPDGGMTVVLPQAARFRVAGDAENRLTCVAVPSAWSRAS